MDNWSALHESEDARDAERTKKKNAIVKESKLMTELSRVGCSVGDTLQTLDCSTGTTFSQDLECQSLANALGDCGWFGDDGNPYNANDSENFDFSMVTGSPNQMRQWRMQMKHAEKAVKANRRNIDGCDMVSGREDKVRPTLEGGSESEKIWSSGFIRPTVSCHENPVGDEIEDIRKNNQLNKEQSQAFDIIVKHFLELLRDR